MTPKLRTTLMVCLLGAPAALADSWEAPRPREFASPSGNYLFRLLPNELIWTKPAQGFLVVRDKGREKVIWRRELVNLPLRVFISDDGRNVVTIDTYARLGGAHSLVVYGDTGQSIADYELEDLLKRDEIRKKVTKTVSSRHWADEAKFAFSRDGTHFMIMLKWGREIAVDLATGDINPKVREVPPPKAKAPPEVAGAVPDNVPRAEIQSEMVPPVEILSAKALNRLLKELQQRQAKGIRGPSIPLNADLLAHINVVGRDAGLDIGLLKDGGRLRWPEVLQEPACKSERERIDSLLPGAIDQARKKQLSAERARDLTTPLEKLNNYLMDKVTEFSPSQFIEAKRFLSRLGDGIKALEEKGLGTWLEANAKLPSKVKKVAELVQFMDQNELKFAPAISGDEAAYRLLYQALVAFQKGETSKLGPR
jgi:hypothetical protein